MAGSNHMDPQVNGIVNLFLFPDRFFVYPLGWRLAEPQSLMETVNN
jgi:hypothetical protein